MSICTSTKSSSSSARAGIAPLRDGGTQADRRIGGSPPPGAGGEPVAATLAIALLAAVAGCSKSPAPTAPTPGDSITLLSTHHLTIAEPSDLTIDETGTILWAVTNHPERVHRLDLQGQVVETLSYDGNDLEGVAYDPRDHTLWLAEENLRQVVHIDLTGAVLSTHALGLTGEHNSGLEGICLNDSAVVFVLNEKRPGLFIRLRPDVTIGSTVALAFAGDYSGMTYHPARHSFWIVSDQSQRLYLWTGANTLQAQFPLPFSKPEGVAFDAATNRVYVVSDATNSLYVFQYATPAPTP